MAQKGRISLSHAAAIAEPSPLDLDEQVVAARLLARKDLQRDLEKALKEVKEHERFKHLAAPPSAQRRHASLKQSGRFDFSYPPPPSKKGKRQLNGIAVTSAAPTPERAAKQDGALGWANDLHPGGQISHRPRLFIDVYKPHFKDAAIQAAELLQAAYDNATRVKMTSARAYSGMPFTGGGGTRLDTMNPQQIEDALLFDRAYKRLTLHTDKWWRVLRNMVLNEPDLGKDRPLTAQELGIQFSAYRSKENTIAVTVGVVQMALLRWLECVYAELPAGQRRSEEGVSAGRARDVESYALSRKRLMHRR